MELNTFSIVARCERTRHLGIAVSSAVPSVGSICAYIDPGIGAVSTQSWVNPYLAIEALTFIREKFDAWLALEKAIADDPDSRLRQIGVVGITGSGAAFTGADCTNWKGHLVGADYAIQGNMLTGPQTLEAMQKIWLNNSSMELAERLMQVLEAGDQAGGDRRGKQSAALKVMGWEIYAEVDLRVDEHNEPVTELRRVLEVAKKQLLPFVQGMPKRHGTSTALSNSVMQLLLQPPASRNVG